MSKLMVDAEPTPGSPDNWPIDLPLCKMLIVNVPILSGAEITVTVAVYDPAGKFNP